MARYFRYPSPPSTIIASRAKSPCITRFFGRKVRCCSNTCCAALFTIREFGSGAGAAGGRGGPTPARVGVEAVGVTVLGVTGAGVAGEDGITTEVGAGIASV